MTKKEFLIALGIESIPNHEKIDEAIAILEKKKVPYKDILKVVTTLYKLGESHAFGYEH